MEKRYSVAVAMIAGVVGIGSFGDSDSAPRKVHRASGVCAEINATILADEKQMGDLTAQNSGEDSAERVTMRNSETSAILEEIRSNKADLRAHGCPAYAYPVSRTNFAASAMKCQIANLNSHLDNIAANFPGTPQDQTNVTVTKPPTDANPCDRSTWKRH